ncbi:MAG: discoidin domain-containing protein, partial [Myxococcales bacterium]|nr:discoidin domain-containing protein [Myxococcales bacterium]
MLTTENGVLVRTTYRVTARTLVIALATLLWPLAGSAVDLIVTSNTSLPAGSYEYGAVVVKAGATLTLASDTTTGVGTTLTATSVTIEAGATLSADGQGYGAGAGPAAGGTGAYRIGGGGGGHSAPGGASAGYNGTTVGGGIAGSPLNPILLGSGGGSSAGYIGGKGGGAIALVVSGTLTVAGTLTANGQNGPGAANDYAAGGGAGGSIHVTAANIDGSGTIRANGGTGQTHAYAGGGGGGGGRIRLIGTLAPTVVLQAFGGTGARHAGAGTIVSSEALSGPGDWRIDNNGVVGTITPVAVPVVGGVVQVQRNASAIFTSPIDADELVFATSASVQIDAAVDARGLRVETGAVLTHGAGLAGLLLAIDGDVFVDADSRIDATGKGRTTGAGVGAVGAYRIGGAGGAHAGRSGGGTGYNGGTSGSGTLGDPETAAAGAAGGGTPTAPGGGGGGLITLTATGTVTVDGLIQANGQNGAAVPNDYAGGGGAGGSVSINAAAVVGFGRIYAYGGHGGDTAYAKGGAGAGGRIIVDASAMTVTASTRGGSSTSQYSGAGTILIRRAGYAAGILLVRNGGYPGIETDLPATAMTYDVVTTGDGARVRMPATASLAVRDQLLVETSSTFIVNGAITAGSVAVRSSAVITHDAAVATSRIAASGTFEIATSARVDVTARGASSGDGVGTAGAYRIAGAGGAYGGAGGLGNGYNGSNVETVTVGSLAAPATVGHAGGGHTSAAGGAGGGRVVLSAGTVFTVDGEIRADGTNGVATPNDYAGGGGSGGAIVLTAAELRGSGRITANGGGGGDTAYAKGGGGGGGRIVIDAPVQDGPIVESRGGVGAATNGGAGTVLLLPAPGALVIDNGGTAGLLSSIPTGTHALRSLTVRGGAGLRIPDGAAVTVAGQSLVAGTNSLLRLNTTLTTGTFRLESAGKLDHSPDVNTCRLTASGDVFLAAGTTVALDGRGFASSSGPAEGPDGNYRIGGGGAGYGGGGGSSTGNNGTAAGASTTGNALLPTLLGSGGGATSGAAGGAGGGLIVIETPGLITVDGTITANGVTGAANGNDYAGGGGAGGTVVLRGDTGVVGTGTVAVNGGAGPSLPYASAGGGGGGRIHIAGPGTPPALQAYGGTSSVRGGGAGTIWLEATGTLIVDGGDRTNGASTPFPVGAYVVKDLLVRRRAAVIVGLGADIDASGTFDLATNATLDLGTELAAAQIVIRNTATLVAPTGTTAFHLRAEGTLAVESGGTITGLSRGSAGGTGSGAGGAGGPRIGGGGAGYGCVGGGSTGNYGTAQGGAAYGSATDPTDLGSGGGNSCTTGGRGGGLLRISSRGPAVVDGSINASGGSGSVSGTDCAGGGGSGGTIVLVAATLSGAGSILVDGGTGGSTSYARGGGGAGGRIAIIADQSDFTGIKRAQAGTGHQAGCNGSVYGLDAIPAVVDLSATTGSGTGAIDLAWTAPTGIDPLTQTYDVRIGTSPITDATFAALPTLPVDAPGDAGIVETFGATGLVGGQTYFIAMRVVDAAGRSGVLSNVATAVASGDELPPARITDLASAAGVLFTWTSPADNSGATDHYELRYHPGSSAWAWDDGTIIALPPSPTLTPGEVESVIVSSLPMGSALSVGVRAVDAAGNAAPVSNLVLVDRTLPTITLVAPLDGATVSKTIDVVVAANDDVAVTTVTLDVDGTIVATDTAAPWQFSLDTRTLTPGAHTLTVTARDAFENAASDGVSITVATPVATTPTLTAPLTGLRSTDPSHDIAGTADAGDTVRVRLDGAEIATVVATGATTTRVEAEAPKNQPGLCVPTATGDGLQLGSAGLYGNVALGASIVSSAEYSATYAAAKAVDGALEDGVNAGTYWLAPNSVTGATLTIDFGDLVSIAKIRLVNSRNGGSRDRSTKDYRLTVSNDGINFTQIHAGTLTEDDITTRVTIDYAVPVEARFLRFHADTYFGLGAGLAELEAYGSFRVLACTTITDALSFPAATALSNARVVATDGGAPVSSGTVRVDISNDMPLFTSNLTGATIDDTIYRVSTGSSMDGGLRVDGATSWTTRYASTRATWDRYSAYEVYMRVLATSGRAMVGLRRPNAGFDYVTLAHAVYFDAGTIRIYEDGNNRASPTTYTPSVAQEVRFVMTDVGRVDTFHRPVGTTTWTKIYSSTHNGGASWHPTLNVYDGTVRIQAIEVRGYRWRPLSEVSLLDPTRPFRFRARLSRPSTLVQGPLLDAFLVDVAGGGVGTGVGTFRIPNVVFPEGDSVIDAIADAGSGILSDPSNAALVHIDSVRPAAITDLTSAKGTNQGELRLNWTSPGDDAAVGTATAYEVRISTSALTEATWASATVISGVPAPTAAGTPATLLLTGLTAGTTYYAAIKAVDDLGNRALLSNVPFEKAKDTSAPAVTFSSPADGTHHRATAVISVSSSDNVGVIQVELFVDSVLIATDTTAPYALDWNTTLYADGPHTVRVEAVDADLNRAGVTRTLIADNTVPTISITPVTTPTGTDVTLAYVVTDVQTPTAQLVVKDDTNRSPPFTYPNEGNLSPVLTVTDLAGNKATATVSFTLDESPPIAVQDLAVAPVDGDPSGAQLTWTAPDDNLTDVVAYDVRYATTAVDLRGDGTDGDLLVNGLVTLNPTRTRLSAAVAAGATVLPVTSTIGLPIGVEVLIHVVQCDAAVEAQVGRHTWNRGNPIRVAAIDASSVTLDRPIPFAIDGSACTAVVQRVPNYRRGRVATDATLTTNAFDGSVGGLLALRFQEDLVVEPGGRITLTGLGYRGVGRQCIKNQTGLQGESHVRTAPARSNAKLRTGGGGGVGTQDAGGGGGGGYATAGAVGVASGGHAGGGSGELGGDPALDSVRFGGAGGQGGADEDGGGPGGGGGGGGALLIAATRIDNDGLILADGATGQVGVNGDGCGGAGCGMGGGGGGAGGTLYLSADVLDLTGTTRASGGAGGSANGCGGAGGVGGVGRVRFDAVTITGAASPTAYAASRTRFDWDAAIPLTGEPTPGAPGTPETFTVTGLPTTDTVFIAMRSTNQVGLVSATSNVAVRDAVPPTVTITDPVDGAVVDRPIVVAASADDDVAVISVTFAVDGVPAGTDTTEPFTFAWDIRNEVPGTHTVTATATDGGGLTAEHTITVTTAPAVPTAPVIHSPEDGSLIASSTVTVVGSAEAGATVGVTVNGAPSGETTAVLASDIAIEAESSSARRVGCVTTGGGLSITTDAPNSTIDLAATSRGAMILGGTTPSAGNDGDTGTGTYWYVIGAQTEELFYVGRVVLPRVELIGRIDLRLWAGDARSYYNYKVVVSRDGTDATTWVDRTGSGVDYQGLQTLPGPETPVRYIDVYLSGNTVNVGAHVTEIDVFAATTASTCLVEVDPVITPGASYYGPLSADADLGDGTLESEVLIPGATRFEDTFGGTAVNGAVWENKLTTVASGVVTLTGGNSTWGIGYLSTKIPYERGRVEAVEFRVRRTVDGHAMFGFFRPGQGFSYTTMPFAIYLTPSSVLVYEDGTSVKTVSTPTPLNQWVDLRIETSPTAGAVYRYKLASATTWTLLHTSTKDGGAGWSVGVSYHNGTFGIDSVRMTGPSWLAASALPGNPNVGSTLAVRGILRRPAPEDLAPVLDRWTVAVTNGTAAAGGPGMWRLDVSGLIEGPNLLRATASDALGTSPASVPVTVRVDTGPPAAITDLTAQALASGVVFLQWSQPNEVPAFYTIWRSTNPITTTEGLSPLISGITELSYGDKPALQGTFHYVVTSTDVAGNESAPSNDAVAAADTAAPKVNAITLLPASPVGLGTIQVTLTASELLSQPPTLAATLPGDEVIPVTLTAGSGNNWLGSLTIPAGTASGTGTWAASLVDLVGNTGSVITTGGSFVIDATPPTVAIAVSPAPPLKAGNATLTLTFSEAVVTPSLTLTPEGKSPISLTLSGSGATWTASLPVDTNTGDGTATLAVTATDTRGNVGTTITAGSTLVIDANAPAAPTLSGVKAPAGYFVLSWTAPEAGLTYKLRRAPAPCTDLTSAAVVQTITTTTTNDQAPVEGLWCYAIGAVDAAGNASPLSNVVSIQSDPPPPEDVTNLHLIDVASNALEVAFTPSANSAGLLAGYRAYVGNALVATLPSTATGYRFLALTPATAYALRVSVFDSNGKESIGASLTGHTLIPNPSGVVALGKTGRIEVSWTAVSPATSLLQYAVYLESAPFTSVAGKTPVAANPGGTTVTLSPLTNGQTYYVAVTSVNKSNAQPLLVTTVAATPGDNEAPEAPVSLAVTAGTTTSLTLAWPASKNTGGDLQGYEILKGGTVAATVGPAVLTTTLTGLLPASAVSVGVRTYDAVGNRSSATTITGYTVMPHPSAVTLVPHHKSLAVSWALPAPTANVQSYRVYALPAAFTDVTSLVPLVTTGPTATTATVTGLTNGTRTYVAVTTVNKSGLESPVVTTVSAIPVDDAGPEAPTNVRVVASGATSLDIAWNPSANSGGDLANYKVVVGGQLIATTTGTLATATGLQTASSFAISVTAVDTLGNASAAGTTTGYTWWPNPAGAAITSVGHQKLTLGWTAPPVISGVSHYAVFASAAPLTTVTGLTPTLLAPSSATSALVTGLQNGVESHLAVVTVNKSGGFNPVVASVPGTPEADVVGPVLTGMKYNGATLASGGIVAVDGTFEALLTDPEGVASTRFLLDDVLLGVDSSASGGFKIGLALEGLEDGLHSLTVEATDAHGNISITPFSFTIQLAAPAAPTITSPVSGAATNKDTILVIGKAKAKAMVRIYRAGAVLATGNADSGGNYSLLVPLVPGNNALNATAANTGGESPGSPIITVVFDDAVPEPPRQVTATAREGGVVRIVWYAAGDVSLSGVAGYTVYRSATPFDQISQATKLNATPAAGLQRDDLPATDGTWYYRVTTTNKAGTESALSIMATAKSDGTLPKATSIVFTPLGPTIGQRVGVGPVDVLVTFSEALSSVPFLSLTTAGGLPLPIALTQTGDFTFEGAFDIDEDTASGVANAVLSARDLVNNRGTQILAGGSLLIDTDAPDAIDLAVTPGSPIQNSATSPVSVQVTLTLDEPLPDEEAPQLSWTLSVSSTSPTELPLARTGPTTWTGGFILPETAGATAERLDFAYTGVDDLGNVSTALGPNGDGVSVEVYQGQLPALEAPFGLVAKALPGGFVRLTWSPVVGATETAIFRQDGAGSLVEVARTTESSFEEDPGADGLYRYAVASVRTANSMESLSETSPTVSVTSDGTAPPPPTALAALLATNGIALSWTASPATEAITYSVYRAVATPIADVTGLTPLIPGLTTAYVVDPTPSLTAHAYVVVAVDKSGNVSPVSNTAYLNPGLLPLSSLSVTYERGTFPLLAWTHPKPISQLGGFRVARDGDDHLSLIGGFSFADTAYDGLEHEYGVRAVDPGGFESPERRAVLPVAATWLAAPDALRRGLLDTVPVAVESESALTGATVRLKLGTKTFLSNPFDAPAGTPVEVPVVVAADKSLDEVEEVALTLELLPEAGTTVRIIDGDVATLGADGYTMELQNEKFTRGITGKVRFVFRNTGTATVDLVTATSSGGKASTEIRAILTDLDGNTLSSAALQQSFGDGILALANGTVVARVAPGATFTSGFITVPVPVGAPDDVLVRVVIDAVHHRIGEPQHAQVSGLSGSLPISLAEPPYRALLTSATPADSYGQSPIALTGVATDTATSQPAAGVPVAVIVSLAGFDRRFDVFTASDGTFTATFNPLPGEGGVYQAWARHPDVNDRTVQATFTIQRIAVGPSNATLSLAANYPHTIPVKAVTSAGTVLTGLRVRGASLPLGVSLTLPPAQNASGAGTWSLPVTVTADSTAPSASSFELIVESDQGTWGTIPVAYTVTQAKPVLTVTPPGLETGVARDGLISEVLTLGNKGLAPFKSLSLSLMNATKTGPAPAWIFIASEKTVAELGVGAKVPITVTFAPTATTPLTTFEPLTVYLRVSAVSGTVADVPLYVWVDDSGVGSQVFRVTDIYTGTLNASGQVVLGVSGAKIELVKQLGEPFTATKTTDASGEVLFSDLPVGTYKYRVSAAGHPASAGSIVIKAGVSGATEVFLSTELVTIEWEVNETTIEDKYTIVLQATFETDVPAAVVTMTPASVVIPDGLQPGDAFTGQITFTNQGLIRAEELLPTLPSSPDYKFELQGAMPTTLNAKQSVTIGYRVTRLTAETSGGATGGGCAAYAYPMKTCYGYKCINGQWAKDCQTFWFTRVVGTCGGGGGGSPIGPIYGGGGYGGGTGGGTGGGYVGPSSQGQPVPGSPGCDPCEHPDLSSGEKECCKKAKEQKASSSVDLITGRYEDEVRDMRVGVLGHDLDIERYY